MWTPGLGVAFQNDFRGHTPVSIRYYLTADCFSVSMRYKLNQHARKKEQPINNDLIWMCCAACRAKREVWLLLLVSLYKKNGSFNKKWQNSIFSQMLNEVWDFLHPSLCCALCSKARHHNECSLLHNHHYWLFASAMHQKFKHQMPFSLALVYYQA